MLDSAPQVFVGGIRRRAWRRVSYGLYVAAGAERDVELAGWSRVLPPTAAFTSLTAAELLGWWLPAPIRHPVFAAVRESDAEPRRSGLLTCRHPRSVATTVVGGLRVTSPPETLLAAARDLGVLDLVILGDSVLRLRQCTIADLWRTARQRRRGAPLLRSVIPLLDARSESAWESVLRVLHHAAGVPVVPQHPIRDGTGRFLARADLWIDGTRRIHEYDGGGHRTAEVHRHDLDRDRRLLSHRWERMGYTSHEVLRGGGAIIGSADAALGRRWEAPRLAAWNQLVHTSLFGPAGRARAHQHWARALG